MSQLALNFERPLKQGPIVPTGEVDKLVARLHGCGWQTAAQLGAKTERDRRAIRAIAEESEDQIISSQRGYKLTIEATLAEMEQIAWWRSQGKKMIRRWGKTWRLWHRHNPDS
jgi:hypothetical protein